MAETLTQPLRNPDDALALLGEIVEEVGPNHYARSRYHGKEDTEPVCLVGHFLARTVPDWLALPVVIDNKPAVCLPDDLCSGEVIEVLADVQHLQDMAVGWGNVLKMVRLRVAGGVVRAR